MNLSQLARKWSGAIVQTRVSPVSRAAAALTCLLAATALIASAATRFTLASLPNIMPLVAGVVAIDLLSRLVPQTRIVVAVQTILYGVLYLVTTIAFGILAAYAIQRFAFPLQDRLLTAADTMLGLDWSAYAHFVDRHLQLQGIYYFAYNTLQPQIALPLLVLALANRPHEVRTYLLAFALAFTLTIFISALLPAAGPVAAVDRASFALLEFTGATPFEHLMRLREAGPLVLTEPPGGIATFPSFHATVAVMTPLALRGFPRIFTALLVLDAAMLGGTVTEGAHYFSDVIAGGAMAFLAYALARRILRLEDRAPAIAGLKTACAA